MKQDRIEMLSLEESLRVAEELGLHERIARLNIFRTLFHRPKTARAISDLLLSLLMDSVIGHRRRELIIMRIGWVTGSEYEWTQHWPLAQQIFECSAEELLAVRDWQGAACFDPVDRAVLTATDELLDTGDLCDETWRSCFEGLGRDAAIEMVAAIATWLLVSKLARGLRVPLEEGVEGWPPDGKIPPAASDSHGRKPPGGRGVGMSNRRAYLEADGSVRAEVLAQQQAARAESARVHGVDPAEVERLLSVVDEQGFVILHDLISHEVIDRIRQESRPFLAYDGRNEFEGFKTRRIYSVIEKTLACNPLIEQPLVLALLDRILLPSYLLSQLQVIEVLPGEVRQPLHHDDGFYPLARPRKPIGAALIWALDDFTADNGATLVYPGSHRWGDVPASEIDASQLVPAVMPAGSAVFFVGTLWHCAGPNHTDAPRLAATTQYCEPWARQQENYSLAISRARAKQCSDRIQSLLGYSMQFPFIGFVDGRDPKRLLRDE